MSLNQPELAKRIQKAMGGTIIRPQAVAALRAVVESIMYGVKVKGSVFIKGFGEFILKPVAARRVVTPQGKVKMMPAGFRVKFYAGTDFKKRIGQHYRKVSYQRIETPRGPLYRRVKTS